MMGNTESWKRSTGSKREKASPSISTGFSWYLKLSRGKRAMCKQWLACVCFVLFSLFLYLVIPTAVLILSQNANKRSVTIPPCGKKGASGCLPSKHKVCMPFCLFFFTLSKKLSGRHVSVQNTIETVSPNLYN